MLLLTKLGCQLLISDIIRTLNGRYTCVKKLLYKGLSIKVIGNIMLVENCKKQRYPQ